MCRHSLVVASRDYSLVVVCGLLTAVASLVGEHGLLCSLKSCGTRAELLLGLWDLLGPGIEPMTPALSGGFFTTDPPEKSPNKPY